MQASFSSLWHNILNYNIQSKRSFQLPSKDKVRSYCNKKNNNKTSIPCVLNKTRNKTTKASILMCYAN